MAMTGAATNSRQQWADAYYRANVHRTQPYVVEASNFFSEEHDGNSWQSLPRRLQSLCRTLREDAREIDGNNMEDKPEDPNEPCHARQLAVASAVFARAPSSFQRTFYDFFMAGLGASQSRWEGCDSDDLLSEADEQSVNESLATLGWMEVRLREPFCEALYAFVHAQIKERIAADFEEANFLEASMEWSRAVVLPWVRNVLSDDLYEKEQWGRGLEDVLLQCFCHIRTEEMFDIVTDYPDSEPAVRELRVALDRTGMHPILAKELRRSLTRRLIHPGASTSQIIDVYINSIKVLRQLDPSDGLLEVVAGSVKSYLRGRKDTVRCIITSLTDETAGGDLYEELRRHDARPLESAQYDSDNDDDLPDLDWRPAPRLYRTHLGDAAKQSPSSGFSGDSGGDILAMLVAIYGSKELFVNEYRVMLADKLLANTTFDTDREVHNLELLKLRFGEVSMRQCEIMIKDIDDSKRIVANIRSTLTTQNEETNSSRRTSQSSSESVFDAAIVSHMFWPQLQKDPMKNHPRIQAELDKFSAEFAKLKNPRRLVWLPQLGFVDLDLEVGEETEDGKVETHVRRFTCSPLHATLISHFEDKESWTDAELSNETGVAEELIQKKMAYWINNRVIKVGVDSEGTWAYQLAAVQSSNPTEDLEAAQRGVPYEEEDDRSGAVSFGSHDAEEMQVYESYIIGMLSNLGQLPLERIHNMLKTFVSGSDHQYDKSLQQLNTFLRQLCREDKLEVGSDGMYKLAKK